MIWHVIKTKGRKEFGFFANRFYIDKKLEIEEREFVLDLIKCCSNDHFPIRVADESQ